VYPTPTDATSHSFRKTVATLVDDEGLSARIGADHLGHSRISITHDKYMARGRDSGPVGPYRGNGIVNAEGISLWLVTTTWTSPNSSDVCSPSRSAHGRPTTSTRFSRPPSRDNVVVETRTCEVPSVASSPMDPADPNWAVPDAERLANAMLNKVKV
jgi:hypothetical protein